jgi:hypothetical protein
MHATPAATAESRVQPDYTGGGLLNLMASIEAACGGIPPVPAAVLLPPEQLAAARNLVLVVVDGLGYRYLTARGAGSAFAARLRGSLTSVFPSTTATAITTTMTGRAPREHGLTGWHLWLEETNTVTAILPLRARDGGAAVAVDPASLFPCASFFDRIALPSFVVSPRAIIDSTFNTRHCGRAAKRPYERPADFFPTVARTLRESAARKLIYAYYAEFDSTAHAAGVGSQAVATEFAALDAAFGRFLDDIAGSDTAVVVTADHGFIDSPPEHRVELDAHPRLAALLARPLCGERRVAYAYVKDGADAAFREYLGEHLPDAVEPVPRDTLLSSGWFGPGPVHPRLAARVGDYALLMRDDWTIKDWLPGEKRHPMIGVHAGLTPDEMLIPLVWANV